MWWGIWSRRLRKIGYDAINLRESSMNILKELKKEVSGVKLVLEV